MNVEIIPNNYQVIIVENYDEPDIELLMNHDGAYLSVGLSVKMARDIAFSLNKAIESITVPSKVSEVNTELSGENRT